MSTLHTQSGLFKQELLYFVHASKTFLTTSEIKTKIPTTSGSFKLWAHIRSLYSLAYVRNFTVYQIQYIKYNEHKHIHLNYH